MAKLRLYYFELNFYFLLMIIPHTVFLPAVLLLHRCRSLLLFAHLLRCSLLFLAVLQLLLEARFRFRAVPPVLSPYYNKRPLIVIQLRWPPAEVEMETAAIQGKATRFCHRPVLLKLVGFYRYWVCNIARECYDLEDQYLHNNGEHYWCGDQQKRIGIDEKQSLTLSRQNLTCAMIHLLGLSAKPKVLFTLVRLCIQVYDLI